jgi:RNA recognition motif-containing protein
MMNIYISNLSSAISSEELKNLFAAHGSVRSAEVVMDVFTGKSRGFGFVEMENETEAQTAIAGLNNSALQELTITVQEAKPKEVHKGSYKVGNGAVNVYRFRKN